MAKRTRAKRLRPPSVDLYYDDFYSGTMDMHPFALGMYFRMILYQLGHGSIPADRDVLLRVTGAKPQEFSKHWDAVRARFELDEESNCFFNRRAQVEMDKKLGIRDKNRTNGRLGGRPKKRSVNSGLPKTKPKGKKEVGSLNSSKEEASNSGSDLLPPPDNFPLPRGDLATEEILELWSRFRSHVFECTGRELTPTRAMEMLMDLARRGPKKAAADLRASIAHSKQGNLLDSSSLHGRPQSGPARQPGTCALCGRKHTGACP